jgi:hypothetical protein
MILHEFFAFEIDAFSRPADDMESVLLIHETDDVAEQVTEKSGIRRNH